MKSKISFFAALWFVLMISQFIYYLHIKEEYTSHPPEFLVMSGKFSRTGGPGIGYRTFLDNDPLTCTGFGVFSVLGAGGSTSNCSLISDDHIGEFVSVIFLKTPYWSENYKIRGEVLEINIEGVNHFKKSIQEAQNIWEIISIFNLVTNGLFVSLCVTMFFFSSRR